MKAILNEARIHEIETVSLPLMDKLITNEPHFTLVEVKHREWRRLFDQSLDEIHYASSCQRVGRCMRLAIVDQGQWVGGIVLGSTFPNVLVRDEKLNLRRFVSDYKERGLKNPWSHENTLYWSELQKIVNHARTFVFPRFQGEGRGIRAHRLLLSQGLSLWREKYQTDVIGLDTLCTHDDSRLFKDNGWALVGRTEGYSSDPRKVFSKRAFSQEWKNIANNVALGRIAGSQRWFVWVVSIRSSDES